MCGGKGGVVGQAEGSCWTVCSGLGQGGGYRNWSRHSARLPPGPRPSTSSLPGGRDGPEQSPMLASGLGSRGCWAVLTSRAAGEDTANLRGQGHLLPSQGTAPPTHPLRTWTVSPGKFVLGFPLLSQALPQSQLPSPHSAQQSGLSGPQAFVGREAAGWGETALLL